MATRAPRSASSFAVSNPIPEEPPVTSALALSIFMPAFYVRMRACPSCGREPQEVLVSADAIAEEMALRRKFFAARIDGWVEPAQQKDRADGHALQRFDLPLPKLRLGAGDSPGCHVSSRAHCEDR
jgi:hypothetical protein